LPAGNGSANEERKKTIKR